MEQKAQDLRILYTKFLSNSLTEHGIKELMFRMGQLSDNELKALINESIPVEEPHALDYEQESLERIFLNIRKKRLSGKEGLKFKLYYKFVAAAVVLIISTLFIYFNLELQSSDQIVIAANSYDIGPGREKAILRLSSGKEIDLDTLDLNKTNIQQSGVKILKDVNGELIYVDLNEDKSDFKIEYNTIITPRGAKFTVILPDGTEVWLNSASSITYPTSFVQAGNRTVKLQGEAYFEVKKSFDEDGKPVPFKVNTGVQTVEVLGTHFNINAYSDEPTVRTTLLEGSVRVNESFTLTPGEQAISFDGNTQVKTVNASEYTDWKTGEFNLKTGDLKTVMRKIARWYDVEIIYDQTAPSNVKLGGWISREKNISSVLNLIQKTGGVHFKLEGRRVTVTR